MKKALNSAVIVLLLLVPVAIGWQAVKQWRTPRYEERTPDISPRAFKGDPAGNIASDKPAKPPKEVMDPFAKAQKGGKPKKQPVTAAELPAEVKTVLEKQAGATEFAKLEMETKGDQPVFTAKWGQKGAESEAKVTADGTLLETKEIVAFETLPAAVQTAIKEAQPSATAFECKKQSDYDQGQQVVTYEVRGQADGEKLPAMRVSETGVVTEKKGAKPGDRVPPR